MSEKWDNVVQEVFGPGTRIVFPRFFESKKNQVTLLEMERDGKKTSVVAKYFVWGDLEREMDTLKKAYSLGLAVPKPVGTRGNIGFLEFIPGKTLKVVADTDPDNLEPEPVGAWLGKFHKAFRETGDKTLLKGDGMLPNFIIHQATGMLYGVDFEESRLGEPTEEIADIAATMLLVGTPRKRINYMRAHRFITSYLKENHLDMNPGFFLEFLVDQVHMRTRFMPHRKNELESYVTDIRSKADMMEKWFDHRW